MEHYQFQLLTGSYQAAACWRQYGEPEKPRGLCSLVHRTLHAFTAPTSAHVSYMDCAKAHWEQKDLRSFNHHGWLQFSGVQAALSGELSLEQALNGMLSFRVQPRRQETFEYEADGSMAAQVVSDAARTLKNGAAFFRRAQGFPSAMI